MRGPKRGGRLHSGTGRRQAASFCMPPCQGGEIGPRPVEAAARRVAQQALSGGTRIDAGRAKGTSRGGFCTILARDHLRFRGRLRNRGNWWHRLDSDQRHSGYEPLALPLSYGATQEHYTEEPENGARGSAIAPCSTRCGAAGRFLRHARFCQSDLTSWPGRTRHVCLKSRLTASTGVP